jgi:hypothetical protein
VTDVCVITFEGVLAAWVDQPTKKEPKRKVLVMRDNLHEALCDLSFKTKIVLLV